jgi:hypothetical protein
MYSVIHYPKRRLFVKFWLLWGFDAVIAFVVLYFFIVGLADGSVSSFNMGLWLIILLIPACVLLGSLWLRSASHSGSAKGVLLILAVPGLLFLLYFLVLLFSAPRWN